MSTSRPPDDISRQDEWDPTFIHARREAYVTLALWGACLVWAVSFCYLTGYLGKDATFDPEQFGTVLGIPAWVFWGIGLPWLVADLFTTWFCFCYMKDDDLGEANEGLDIQEEIAEIHADERKEAP